ncbi:LacI family DNA-binding transcriptional regulator [Pseudokineococcus basanitobsidens]|uniref:LacI family DNA-binding transcriptional regulator n=1 Tax=Pseudokineococcus basanitobsidens TaxID=1926649 RepID=A0ABU8RJ17_9ACTN
MTGDDASRSAAADASAVVPAPVRTLQHVAELAGVSVKTASRALNDEPYVAPATAARVRDAAARAGYRVNATARDLRRGAPSPLVGLVSADLANPFYSRLAAGIEREIRPAGLLLVTSSSDEDPDAERAVVASLLERQVRALVVVSTTETHEHLAEERRPGTPLVMVDRSGSVEDADSVTLDNRAGARAAAEHLLTCSSGAPRLSVVTDLRRLETGRARLAGVADALHAAGLDPLGADRVREAHDVRSAERAVAELLAADPPPTAVLAMNNRLATGAVRAVAAAGERGARVAVAGFDDLELAAQVGLTVVAYDAEEMGRAVGRLVLERVRGERGPARRVVVPTTLVVNSPCGRGHGADAGLPAGAGRGHDRVTSLTPETAPA